MATYDVINCSGCPSIKQDTDSYIDWDAYDNSLYKESNNDKKGKNTCDLDV